MYTIFKNDSLVILTDDAHFLPEKKVLKLGVDELPFLIDRLRKSQSENYLMYGSDLQSIWESFKNHFIVIEAAGGVVTNGDGSVLFIVRNGVWDLPKGKVDDGEGIRDAAIREVKEECGFKNISMGGFITKTYHIYEEKEKQVLKITHWFAMNSEETSLTPQLEEGITDLAWKPLDNLNEVLNNTYPNIRLLISKIDR